MIEDRLTSLNTVSESNTVSAKKALQGEKIKVVFNPDESTTVFIMESGTSFELYANGGFSIKNKQLTTEIINTVKPELKEKHDDYIALSNI